MEQLPNKVLKILFDLEPKLRFKFLSLNQEFYRKTKQIIYQDIHQPEQLQTIINSPHQYSHLVKSIQLINPLDQDLQLITQLTHLNQLSLIYHQQHQPPISLTNLLSNHTPNLNSFSIDFITTNRSSTDNIHRPIRWDAHSIQSIPSSLTHLSISSLSVIGARNLSDAFQSLSWINLTHLTLTKSLFIDDQLMNSIVIGSKKIKLISIQTMSGTKLTQRGIEQLFSGLDGLEQIELLDVEGRFSKLGWLKLDNLPPSLRTIKFGYHETGSYHSWTLDHLQNILSLLTLYPHQLEHFSVTRFVPSPTMLPGRHASFPELACNNRTSPQMISKEQILSILTPTNSLKELNLDWWLISVEALEVIVKALPNLQKLTALVDAPFHRIIASTVFVHSKIHTLTVSIPPEHTPLVQELSQLPITPTITSPESPISTQQSPSSTLGSPPGIWGSQSTTSPIPTRDLKKFIKRAGHLKEIIWTGRGGLGAWKFVRNGSSALNVRVQFTPIAAQLPPEAFVYQQLPPTPTHHRAGSSSPRQSFSSSLNGVRASGNSRRTSSLSSPGTDPCSKNTFDSHQYSRRSSSSASLATSHSSALSHPPTTTTSSSSSPPSDSESTFDYHRSIITSRRSLEDIPGTPVGFHPFSSSNDPISDHPNHLPLIPNHQFCPQKFLIDHQINSKFNNHLQDHTSHHNQQLILHSSNNLTDPVTKTCPETDLSKTKTDRSGSSDDQTSSEPHHSRPASIKLSAST